MKVNKNNPKYTKNKEAKKRRKKIRKSTMKRQN